MKRVELREEIRDRIGDTAGALANDDEINLWLALAIRRTWREWPWSFQRAQETINTVDGTQGYNLAADCQRVTKVVDTTSNYALSPKRDYWLQEEYPDTAYKSSPLYYAEGGLSQAAMTSPPRRVMNIWPIPDAAYALKVTYHKLPASMTQDDHYTPLPEDFDEALIVWVLGRFYRKLDDLAMAEAQDIAYQEELSRLVPLYGTFQGERFTVVEYDPFLE